MPEELETHSDEWYVTQYNRNRTPDDWVDTYEELIALMNSLNRRSNGR